MPDVADRARAAATAAFGWVAAAAVDTGGTAGWCEDGTVDDSLYIGSAGVLLACAEARASGLTGPEVARAADLARARLLDVAGTGAGGLLDDDGLFSGWAGVAVALRAWERTTGDETVAAAADTVLAGIAQRSVAPGNRYTDLISGDAGVLVALLTAGTTPATLAAAGRVADRLVAAAEDTEAGPQWRMRPDYPLLMPNLSHGAAGVGYALALAGRALERPDLTAVAVRAAETVLAVGRTPAGWAAPLSIPSQPHRPEVFFGWCHGPTGTMRLFDLLGRQHPDDPRWPETVAQCYEAVRTSGLPERHTPGFWDNVARCCGTAGVGTMVLDRYQASGDPDLLAWADLLATDVLDRTVTTPDGVCWSNTEHTATPSELRPEPGFMIGAAGIAGWLARLAAVHADPSIPAVDLGVVPRWV